MIYQNRLSLFIIFSSVKFNEAFIATGKNKYMCTKSVEYHDLY